jgi:hypothetical protein
MPSTHAGGVFGILLAECRSRRGPRLARPYKTIVYIHTNDNRLHLTTSSLYPCFGDGWSLLTYQLAAGFKWI